MARPRKLKLFANINGFASLIGEVKIGKYADTKKPVYERTCPTCGKLPEWVGGYDCECGSHYNQWSKLKMSFNGKEVTKPKLPNGGQANLYVVDKNAFKTYDATKAEYGLIVNDTNTAKNLKKLLLATELLGKVIMLKWNDTYEEVIGLLVVTASQRVVIKELIPTNLLIPKETLHVNFKEITDKELEEAKTFVEMLKTDKTVEEILTISDYRATGLVEAGKAKEVAVEKVRSLEDLIKQTA